VVLQRKFARVWVWPALVLLVAAGLWLIPRVAGQRGVVVTQELLEAQRRKWQSAGWQDYRVEWRVSGGSTGHYQVQVRGGKITRALFDEQPLQERQARYWTPDAMFSIIERELQHATGQTQQSPWAPGQRVEIWAEFDEVLGIPRWWQRSVAGAAASVTVECLRLERIESP
jgi:hypothetical protein